MVRLWVANTDPDWFDYLAAQPSIDEVNFWQPSGTFGFNAVSPGELFVFRLKSPRNAIGGYGVFSHASTAPISLAWEAFGIKNGAVSFEQMKLRVGKYRGETPSLSSDYQIGCRIVVEPVFFSREEWIPQPESWAAGIVVGKTYDTDHAEGLALWEALQSRVATRYRVPGISDSPQASLELNSAPRFGEPTLITPRLGQGAFRLSVTDFYGRACAVSGGRVLPALDAAHIRPYSAGGSHEVRNGLLLRRDIHSVFDAGYVTVDKDHRLVVSDRVRTEFNNGNEYRRLHGQQLTLPANRIHRPDPDLLVWHNENVYRD